MSSLKMYPHLLRGIFADRMGEAAGIPDRFVDAFCGRLGPGELQRHHSDYQPRSLKALHLTAETHLTLQGPTDHVWKELTALTHPRDLPFTLPD
ncbi:MAG: hypothetical protein QW587_09970 [Candidatus Bathyarchaeia archaeon]